jgi:hypothetical protein
MTIRYAVTIVHAVPEGSVADRKRWLVSLTSAWSERVDTCFQSAVGTSVIRVTRCAADKSASAGHEADAEADRAMAWLKQAVSAGYKDAAHMNRDSDLDSLRALEDFKQLVAELERVKTSEPAKP